MMQVWLVLLGAVLLWRGDQFARQQWSTAATVATILGYGCLAISVVLVFVNGGTTG